MEKYNLSHALKAFGFKVETFPNGVGAAFDSLINALPNGKSRTFVGIGECIDGGIVYKAATLEMYDGEAEEYNYDIYTLEKGNYLKETIKDWVTKTSCIKDIFEEMFNDERSDRGRASIEIYRNENEMDCLVSIDEWKELQYEFKAVFTEVIQLLSSFSKEQINMIPFEGSWTAGQVAQHIILSGRGFMKLLSGPSGVAERDPVEFAPTIKGFLLDFDKKFESPAVVRPEIMDYEKDNLITTLGEIKGSISMAIKTSDFKDLCLAEEVPVLGFLTRLEVIHFVIAHTKRHIKQLKNIHVTLAKTEAEEVFKL